jgi:hypothetical protein
MLYSNGVLDENIKVEEELQLSAQSTPQKYNDLNEVQNDIMTVATKKDNVLPLLNNHILLESMVMNSMALLEDNPINRLIPAAHLCAFIRFNKGFALTI